MNDRFILDIKKGSKKTFRKVFDEYFGALCSFGGNYLENTQEVEDLVQEAFISFWLKRNDFEDMASVKSFLYTSLRNKCLNVIKHNAVQKKHEQSLVHELESDHYFSKHVIEEEVLRKLHNEINSLPESAQKIMLLALNGLKNPEIAEELNISVNTVKTQKKIAYSKLKNKLEPVMQGILLAL